MKLNIDTRQIIKCGEVKVIKRKITTLVAATLLVAVMSVTSYAYTPQESSYGGMWELQEDGNWKYGTKKWNQDNTSYMEYYTGVRIVDGMVCEFDANGVFQNRGQVYYHSKFKELNEGLGRMNEIITMPIVEVADTQMFWAYYNGRLSGSSGTVQYLTGPYLNSTNLSELKVAADKQSEFKGNAMSYLSKVYANKEIKDKKGKAVDWKTLSIQVILKDLHAYIHSNCTITEEGSKPMYVLTGTSSANSRDVAVAVNEILIQNGIPSVTCFSVSTGKYYNCVYNIQTNAWEYYDFSIKESHILNVIPDDLVFYY